MCFKPNFAIPEVAALCFCLIGGTTPAYAELDWFGFSVAVSGATAIVGAHADDDNGTDSGSAYLIDAAAPGMCPWDLDDSGSVGAADLLTLLASWGQCKGCPADFDDDGNVGASDLLALLVNWGPCL